jgi:hypothetical protein
VARNVDYVSFTLTATTFVSIQTGGASGDTEMYLYGKGNAQIAYNDDSGGSYWSRIDRSLKAGTYTIRVQEYRNDGIIPAYTLRLSVRSVRPR